MLSYMVSGVWRPCVWCLEPGASVQNEHVIMACYHFVQGPTHIGVHWCWVVCGVGDGGEQNCCCNEHCATHCQHAFALMRVIVCMVLLGGLQYKVCVCVCVRACARMRKCVCVCVRV